MNWKDARKAFPNKWLLIEAVHAHSENNKRILEEISIVKSFLDSISAMENYIEIHKNSPQRELYIFHTDREVLEITERHWAGIRSN